MAVECPDDSWRAHVIPPALNAPSARGVCDEANKGGPCYLDWEVFLVGFLTLAGIFPSTVRVANCARNQCVNRQRPQQKDTVVKQSYEQEGS